MTVYEDLAKSLAAIHKMDWTPDGSYTKQMKTIRYVTLSKMKCNVAEALSKNDLCLAVEYSRPEWLEPAMQSKPQHVLIEMKATIYGRDGDSVVYRSWGQGATNDDKGVSIARAYAMRTFLIDTFLISDYIEPEESDSVEYVPQDTAKAVLQKKAVPEEPVKPKTAAPGPKTVETQPNVKEAVPEQDPKTPSVKSNPLSEIQKRALVNLRSKVDIAVGNGSMSSENAAAAYDAINGIENDAMFREFMVKKSSWGI